MLVGMAEEQQRGVLRQRCAEHDLALAGDGLCVLCRREQRHTNLRRRRALSSFLFGGLALATLLVLAHVAIDRLDTPAPPAPAISPPVSPSADQSHHPSPSAPRTEGSRHATTG